MLIASTYAVVIVFAHVVLLHTRWEYQGDRDMGSINEGRCGYIIQMPEPAGLVVYFVTGCMITLIN
jgi:hypothetical protein